MKIVLINENSQASKNELIYKTLCQVVEPKGHEVFNYGMYSAEDHTSLTYVQNGILAAILLNSGAADYVITGCGTGSGAMLACNSFPGVICGLVVDPADAFLFAQINDGNAISLPFAKGFGWGAELNLGYIFEKLFEGASGQGNVIKLRLCDLCHNEIQQKTSINKTEIIDSFVLILFLVIFEQSKQSR